MLAVAVIFFIFASVFGLVVLTEILRNHTTPKPVVLIHGFLAGIGLLIALTYAAMGHSSSLYVTGLVVLILAAIGGFTLFAIDVSQKKIPKLMAILHPILAITGVVIFIVYLYLLK